MIDKRTVVAFALIALVFMGWSFLSVWLSPRQAPPVARDTTTVITADTTPSSPPEQPATTPEQQTPPPPSYATLSEGATRFIVVESPLYKAILNTRGGLLTRFQLKKYNAWYGDPVQLISDSTGFPGVLGLRYTTPDGARINTEQFVFDVDAPDSTYLSDDDSLVITARLRLPSVVDSARADSLTGSDSAGGGIIEKRFVFHGDSYGMDFDVMMRDMASQVAGNSYDIVWPQGLMYQEFNSVDESSSARVQVQLTNDDEEIKGPGDLNERERDTVAGAIDWVALKVKYFAAALIPSKPINGAVRVSSITMPVADNGRVEHYDVALAVPYSGGSSSTDFTLFVGPLDFQVVSDYGLGSLIDLGFTFVVRPIAEWIMLPMFRLLHYVIPNWGFVILVFALLIRLVLWPLSIPQIRSSRKMQLLQPEISRLREQNKDDSQAQQMATMKLYQEYGINPVGGCLPMVLQLPILYALWGTLRASIELRQADFMLWIHDLSTPDIIVHLPFTIPLLGAELSGLALIMGVTLFIQQKMMISDPRQKALVYVMPIVLTLAFNHFPSGLNLYYLVFNILSIGQQLYLTKWSKNELTLEQMKKEAKKKKKGRFAQMMEEAQKMQQQQKKTGSKVEGRTPVEPRSKKNGKR